MLSRELKRFPLKTVSSLFTRHSNYHRLMRPNAFRYQITQSNMRLYSDGPKRGAPGERFEQPRTNPNEPPSPTDTSGYYSDEDNTSFQSDRKFSNFILFTGAFALLVIYVYSNVMSIKKKREQKIQNVGKARYTGKAEIGGPWMLYDTNGNVVTHKNFEGKYYLIYFGFTMCPDVCPISLNKIAKARRIVQKSKEYKYFDLECIFVSLDPDRDTNERIKEYCSIFDETMIGLTHKSNEDPELKQILKSFKIHSSKIFLTDEEEKEDEESMKALAPEVIEKMKDKAAKKNDKYSLDHTIVTYLMGPDNEFMTYLGSNLSEKEMADIILDEICGDLGKKMKM